MNKLNWQRTDAIKNKYIAADETHVWLLPCRQSGSAPGEFWTILDEGERRRANRFHFEKDRDRFVVSRATVRKVLAGYLRCPPGEVAYDLADHGKPRLAERHATSIKFNQSISGDWAMLALTLDCEVGVDVERIDSKRADRDIVNGYFGPGEICALDTLQEDEWLHGFFNCWTRKEAFIKATGEGLSRPLDSFEVSVVPGQPASLVSVQGCEGDAGHWRMADLAEVPGYASALVVEGPIGQLQCFTWTKP